MSYGLLEIKTKLGKKTMPLLKEVTAMKKAHERMVPEVDLATFGKSLRNLREDADMSLREMARLLGVSVAFLSDCELGHRNLQTKDCMLFLHYCQTK